ncbi:MAG: OmcA/MtrC family decaheme c-type cytochrome [Alphaproteobacteria bacterium]|nr:OmcA/MtrC family decaheme c-type cytochrome [Alphaproteobacteria bacterium]
MAAKELADADKYMVDITITNAAADAAGVATVDFTVMNGTTPVTTISSISAGIFKLAPAGGEFSYNRWVPYLWRSETVEGTQDAEGNLFLMPDGTQVNQGYRESSSAGTLVNNGGGSYTYTFGQNLTTATLPVGGTPITYERNLTHRVSVYMGGHNGPTGEGDFDFVPDGSAVTETRNIVETATCKKCHGTKEFAGHGGDRVTVEGCATCHSPDSKDAQSGESIELAVMIHKIHAGNELPTVAGPDGVYYDNPWTMEDETADNGEYILWGHSTTPVSWEHAAFPAVIANCQACHPGGGGTGGGGGGGGGTGGGDAGNWKNVPSRAACGSCHDDVNFATGEGHFMNLAQLTDDSCTVCHDADAVTSYHNWTAKDIRNKPEFDITLTTDTPARGYYIAGESPVISIALTDSATGAVIVPSTVIEDPTAEGCVPVVGSEDTLCTVPRDGLFRSANVYVSGPRAQRIPVLTRPARAKVTSADAGPWDLSTGGSLRIRVDSGMAMLAYNTLFEYEGYGADELITGDITVAMDNAFFADPAAATPAEVANLLNADPTFHERAFAYLDEGFSLLGRLSIRTRGILEKDSEGNVIRRTAQPNIQVVGILGLAGMFTGNEVGTTGRSAAQARIRATASNTDPKADFTDPTAIKYTLDPVDDLVAGTYVINVEFADASRGPGNPPEPPFTDYRTPSVAVATFQVKQEAVEKPIADGCTACHWSDAGVGFVLDFPRHNKPFNEQALDQCGGCHDYAASFDPTSTTADAWGGGKPISKRVHAVHNGSALNYPTLTVDHEETSAFGRNWRITYPMNIRNCESCHPAATTSGTWKTNPNRLACMGCHDSDAATAHMKSNTYDPTPLIPWSGDEAETCKVCH